MVGRQSGDVELDELRQSMFLLRDADATAHLLRVSAGLDSLVLGEGQILAQVKNVFESGQGNEGFGRHLNGLFKAAVTAGKRVRSETKIASGAVSVSSAAAELALMKLPTNNYECVPALAPSLPNAPCLCLQHADAACAVAALRRNTAPSAYETTDCFHWGQQD